VSGRTRSLGLAHDHAGRSREATTSPQDEAAAGLPPGGIMEPTPKDFESALAELERIVKALEEGDQPLEKSLELYERGVQLSRFCHGRLEDAERRIELLDERGSLRPAPASLSADPRDEEA
jgi:exodeoxyribonuclease VII small subunit